MKEDVGITDWPRVGVKNSKWGAVQRQRLTVQWNGRLDLGAVIMTLRDTPEFAKRSPRSFPQQIF